MIRTSWSKQILTTTLAGLLTGALAVQAGYPLVVDDADVLEVGEIEWVVSYDFVLGPEEIGYALPVQFTRGIFPRLDFSVEGGYQFFEDREDESRIDGWLDTIAALKWLAIEQGEAPISLAVEGGIKLPTASSSRGLGSGNLDLALNVALTRAWDGAALDVNLGYLFSEHFRGRRRDGDEWFYGTALRCEATETVELFAEVFGESAAGSRTGTTVTTRTGASWEIVDGTLLAGGVGTSFGSDSPDFLASFGLVRSF